MISEARRLSGGVIGPAIAEGVSKLRAVGEQALFAGVIVGWETGIGQDFDTRRDLGYAHSPILLSARKKAGDQDSYAAKEAINSNEPANGPGAPSKRSGQ
jgi:hypothetical protein